MHRHIFLIGNFAGEANCAEMKENQIIDSKKIGNRILILSWCCVLMIEILVMASQNMNDGQQFGMDHILDMLKLTLPFLALCLVHNYAIAPILVEKNETARYAVFSLLAYILFATAIVLIAPRPEIPHPSTMDFRIPAGPQFHGPAPVGIDAPPVVPNAPGGQFNKRPRPITPTILLLIIGFLVILVNLGVQYFIKGLSDKERTRTLEQENLEYRLEYLRSQISPHFFMNTLNNIHALVDIDSDKAKDCIVQLSKLMRHVLYESSSKLVTLTSEIEFAEHYLSLMKIRYTDMVHITTSFPSDETSARIPPLILATMLENSFKHGISAYSESFVDMSIQVADGRISVRCSNSIAGTANQLPPSHGIGMDNIRKRLELLYGNDYTFEYGLSGNRYEVLANIPADTDKY